MTAEGCYAMLVIPQDMVEISMSYFAERQLALPGFTGSILQKVQQEIDVKAWETSEIQPPQLVDGLMKGWSFAECPDVMPMAFEFIVGASPRSLGTVGGGRGNPKVTKIGRKRKVADLSHFEKQSATDGTIRWI